MKPHGFLILLCVAMLAIACVPATAGGSYKIEAEDLTTSPAWTKVTAGNLYAGNKVPADGARSGYALSIIDSIKVSPPDNKPHDMHGTGGATNVEDLLYRNIADPGEFAFGFANNATAVFRIKTTDEQAFSTEAWERSIILAFTDGAYRKCVGFAVRPSGAVICNSGGGTTYGGVIPSDNTVWHTWTIVGKDMSSTGGKVDVYLDGARVISDLALNLTADTILANSGTYINGLGVGSTVSGTVNDGTGSWLIDWVSYKQGVHPKWDPWVPGSISGVVSKAGDPSVKVAGATVTLSTGATTTTGADGSYSFTDLDLDTFTITVSKDGYFGKKTGVALSTSAPSPVKDIAITASPASGPVVYDTFTVDSGDLTTTEDAQLLPWLTGDQKGNWTEYYVSDGALYMYPVYERPAIKPLGFSIGGGFQPANVDITAEIRSLASTEPGWWAGITYRQTVPCAYDDYEGQNANDAGYLVFAVANGSRIYLWRNGAVAYADTMIDWTQPHKIRVIAYGDYHEVQLDGTRIINVREGSKLTGGYVGLSRYESTVLADDFRVQPLTDGSSIGSVSGSVYSAAAPATKLGGATVVLSDGRQVLADASGNYSFALNGFDSLTVTAKFAGYLDKTVSVDPIMGANTADIGLDADSAYRSTIAAARTGAVDSPVAINGKVLTASWSGTTMYLEEPNRAAGIKVVLPAADTALYSKAWKSFDARGILRADAAGERYIEATSVYQQPVGNILLQPVFMNGRTVLDKAAGVDVTGLAVKVVGTVTAVNNPTDFTINDGSGDLKIIVHSSVGLDPWPAVGEYIDAEGIVSLDGGSPETAVRCIRLWNTNGNHLGVMGGFEHPAGPMYGWGWGDTSGGACTLKFTETTISPRTGSYCAEFVNTYGYGAGIYGTLFFIAGALPGYEYELSCWAKGVGVIGTSQASHATDWSNYSFNLPIGDFDWTNVGQKFTANGDLVYIRFNIVNTCSPMAIDDVLYRWARGSIHVLQPAPAPPQ